MTGFYEAITRLYRAGRLPKSLINELASVAQEIDEERGAR